MRSSPSTSCRSPQRQLQIAPISVSSLLSSNEARQGWRRGCAHRRRTAWVMAELASACPLGGAKAVQLISDRLMPRQLGLLASVRMADGAQKLLDAADPAPCRGSARCATQAWATCAAARPVDGQSRCGRASKGFSSPISRLARSNRAAARQQPGIAGEVDMAQLDQRVGERNTRPRPASGRSRCGPCRSGWCRGLVEHPARRRCVRKAIA